MRLLLNVLFVSAVAASDDVHAANQPTAAEHCKLEYQSQCEATYKKSSSQCDRYFIDRTEAKPMCHNAAQADREKCLERTAQHCEKEQPDTDHQGEESKQ